MTSLEIFFESPISQIWLKDLPQIKSVTNPDLIIQYVCDFFCQKKEDVLSKKRYLEICIVRQFCMYLIRHKTNLSYKSIGHLFKLHHTSVIIANKKIENYISYDEELKNYLTLLDYGVTEKHPIINWWDKKRYKKSRIVN